MLPDVTVGVVSQLHENQVLRRSVVVCTVMQERELAFALAQPNT
jgi:hypothetical protein